MYLMSLNPTHINRLIQYKAEKPTGDGGPSIALSMMVFAAVADTFDYIAQMYAFRTK